MKRKRIREFHKFLDYPEDYIAEQEKLAEEQGAPESACYRNGTVWKCWQDLSRKMRSLIQGKESYDGKA